jgi:hypothetical protein
VHASRRPETWKIGGFVAVSVALGPCMLALFAYAMVACLWVNDTVKVLLTRRWVPQAVA